MDLKKRIQDRALRRETHSVLAVIKQQWLGQTRRHGDFGVQCDAERLMGEMALPRLKAHQMSTLYATVTDHLADEGIPLVVTLECDSTIIAWRYNTAIDAR